MTAHRPWKFVMLAAKKLSWSSTTQWSDLSYQYAASLAVAHSPWHVAEQIYKSCCRQVWTVWVVMHSPYLKQRKAGRRGVAMHQPWCRISAVFCVQSVCTTTLTSVSTCIHRQMVGIHVPAACSDVAANTTAVPCTIGAHTPTILLGCLPYASSFKLTYALVCSVAAKLYENLTVVLNYSVQETNGTMYTR